MRYRQESWIIYVDRTPPGLPLSAPSLVCGAGTRGGSVLLSSLLKQRGAELKKVDMPTAVGPTSGHGNCFIDALTTAGTQTATTTTRYRYR